MSSGFNFLAAKFSHRRWQVKMHLFLDGKESVSFADIPSPRDCDLGKWLYGLGLESYGYIKEVKDLEKQHSLFHEILSSIVDLKRQGARSLRGGYMRDWGNYRQRLGTCWNPWRIE